MDTHSSHPIIDTVYYLAGNPSTDRLFFHSMHRIEQLLDQCDYPYALKLVSAYDEELFRRLCADPSLLQSPKARQLFARFSFSEMERLAVLREKKGEGARIADLEETVSCSIPSTEPGSILSFLSNIFFRLDLINHRRDGSTPPPSDVCFSSCPDDADRYLDDMPAMEFPRQILETPSPKEEKKSKHRLSIFHRRPASGAKEAAAMPTPSPALEEATPQLSFSCHSIDISEQLRLLEEQRRLLDEQIAALRAQMEQQKPDLSPLRIDSYCRIFVDAHDIEIPLYPLHKAVYILFLLHPEGIDYQHIFDYRDQLRMIYGILQPNATVAELTERVKEVATRGSLYLNQLVSRTNRTIRTCLASDICSHYTINGERGGVRRVEIADRTIFEHPLDQSLG